MGVLLNDKVQVSIVGRCYGQRIILTHMYECVQAAPAGQSLALSMSKLMAAVDAGGVNDLITPYTDCLNNDYLSLFVRAQVITPVRSIYYQLSSNHPGSFGNGTVANDAAALTLRTDLAGRRYLGTKHVGPLSDDSSIAGLLTAAITTRLNALGQSMINTFQIAVDNTVYRPVVYHRGVQTSTPITNWAVGPQSRVQRRRTVGLGE